METTVFGVHTPRFCLLAPRQPPPPLSPAIAAHYRDTRPSTPARSRPPSLLAPLSSLLQSPRSLSDPRPRHPLPWIAALGSLRAAIKGFSYQQRTPSTDGLGSAPSPPTNNGHHQRTRISALPSSPRHQWKGARSTSAAAAAPGRRSTSAIRSLFSRPLAAAGGAPSGSGVAALPDLHRRKSFSCGGGGDALAAAGKPQRRSCDVRGRSTLWALFHQDDRQPVRDGTEFGAFPASSSAAAAALAAKVLSPPQPPPLPPPACVPAIFNSVLNFWWISIIEL
eukprot:XP_020397679.1 actin cytoskeleton-regulatory complex protein pan1 [Zea mays]